MSHSTADILPPIRRAAVFRWPSLKKTQTRFSCNPPNFTTRRRRKLPYVRLGGKKRPRLFVYTVFKRLKLRWLRLRYVYMLKKLKALYASVVRDLVDAGAALDAVQKRILLETYYTVPIMPMSIATVPSHVHKLELT